MREDSYPFSFNSLSASKYPRFVVKIEFETDSVYITSHDDIIGVPGTVISGALMAPSAVSQKIVPDEGRSEIGAMTFSLVDIDSQFTTEMSERFQNGQGMRGRKVKLWVGYKQINSLIGYGTGEFGTGEFGIGGEPSSSTVSFSDFQLFQTQVVKDCSYHNGSYAVNCSDITRQQRVKVFDLKLTTLRSSITATDTTIPVTSTLGFQPVRHGSSYADAPNATVGYIKIGSEVIRYTGLTSDTFTGCTRGVLNTKAAPVDVKTGTEADNKPKVEEYVYIEMPAAKLAYAIMTGIIYGTAYTFPSHWHMGIDPDLITTEDYTGIGLDLFDTSDDTAGFVVRFGGLKKIDGKKFIESELLMLMACYQPVYSDGTLGLRRMTQVLANASYDVLVTENEVVNAGALLHDMSGMYNQLAINWNYNGEDFTRRTVLVDATSISANGAVPLKTLNFKGLYGSRHTVGILKQRLANFRDRYTSPPEKITLTVMPSLSKYEVGDIVRVQLTNVRDFAGNAISINRSFEIQQKTEDFATGNITWQLFGSTAAANDEELPPSDTNAAVLPDAYYTSAGTDLASVMTISVIGGVGTVSGGPYTLTGNDNLNASGAIYYYNGDLRIPDGVVIHWTKNIQMRVKGFLTIEGDMDSIGAGIAGVADNGSLYTRLQGTPGYFGTTQGMEGIHWYLFSNTIRAAQTKGLHSVAPILNLSVSGNSLLGLPGSVMGTSGGPGGPIYIYLPPKQQLQGNGGTGANGGGGIVFVTRGMSFGASATVNTSGANSAATTLINTPLFNFYPGAGAVGCPGCMYILIDGTENVFPDVSGAFIAKTGTTGARLVNNMPSSNGLFDANQWQDPREGYIDPGFINNVDYSNVAYRIQYIPAEETAQEDATVAITAITVSSVVNGNKLTWEYNTNSKSLPYFEVYASLDNDRTNSQLVTTTTDLEFTHVIPSTRTYYYWIKARIDGLVSEWYPLSSTGGIQGIAGQADTDNIVDGAVTESSVTATVANGNLVYAATTQPTSEASGVNCTAAYTAAITVKVQVSWAVDMTISNLTSGAAVGTSYAGFAGVMSGIGSPYFSPFLLYSIENTSGEIHISGSNTFTVFAGQTATYTLSSFRSWSTSGASPAQTHSWRNASITILPIKR